MTSNNYEHEGLGRVLESDKLNKDIRFR